MVVADTVVCVAMVVSSVARVASRQLMIVSTVASQAMIIIGVAPSSVFCRVSSLIVGFWEAAAFLGVAIFTDTVGVFLQTKSPIKDSRGPLVQVLSWRQRSCLEEFTWQTRHVKQLNSVVAQVLVHYWPRI